jgi:hypothetical protein
MQALGLDSPAERLRRRPLVALQAAGLSYILGARIRFLPDVVREWRDKHSAIEKCPASKRTDRWSDHISRMP